ncbi:hypothetical protein AX17_000540 [Amanita inopinata Kibby_2008]|nr:hypothetical protein AX17_000540 [Amanita inopinata Kibby_2008]
MRLLHPSLAHRLCRLQRHQRRNNTTQASPETSSSSSGPRIASEFNGLLIPSRQDVLSHGIPPPAHSTSDLSSGSLASRLARSLPPAPAIAQKTTTRRLDSTIQQRRAERIAREEAMSKSKIQGRRLDVNGASQKGRTADGSTTRSRVENGRHGSSSQRTASVTASANRALNHRRFEGLDALGQFTVNTSAFRQRRDQRPRRTDATASSRRHPTRTPTRRVVANSVTVSRPSTAAVSRGTKRATKRAEKGDVKFDAIENGGEEPTSAAFTGPEILSANLTNVFGSSLSKPGLEPVRHLNKRSPIPNMPFPVKDRTRYIVETFGGDYSRYTPPVTRDYFTRPNQLGAVKQAQLALYKNKAVDLQQRKTLLNIIQTSGNSQVART